MFSPFQHTFYLHTLQHPIFKKPKASSSAADATGAAGTAIGLSSKKPNQSSSETFAAGSVLTAGA